MEVSRKWAILELPHSILFFTEDHFRKNKPKEFDSVSRMRKNYEKHQQDVTLNDKQIKILENQGIKFLHLFGPNRLKALNGKYHWFTGYQKGDAFRFNEQLEREIERVGTIEVQFSLFIVSCTKDKIWDKFENFNNYCPACFAYIGNVMQIWNLLEESRKYPWIIFSSKYGFLDYDHPIRFYDLHFTQDEEKVVSLETLEHQILYHSYKTPLAEIQIKDFKKIFFVGSDEYYLKLLQIFEKIGIKFELYNKFVLLYQNKNKVEKIMESINFIAQFLCEPSFSFEEIKEKLPENEGVYVIISNGEVIYVGSSKNLKFRLDAHFTGSNRSVLRNKLLKEFSNNEEVDDFLKNCKIKIFTNERDRPVSTKMFEHLLISFFEPKYNS